MAKLTQEELEQPAKVYQIEAVEREITNINKSLITVSGKLDKVITQTSGVVTKSQLDIELSKIKDDILKEVDLKYEPTKKASWWVSALVITVLAGQIIIQIFRN